MRTMMTWIAAVWVAASHPAIRADVIAKLIPAQSFATGRNPVVSDRFIPIVGPRRNIDLMDLRNGWPSSRENGNWRHVDNGIVAYVFIHKWFDRMVEESK